MVVTYRDLSTGYTLKDGDTLACIHGITGYMAYLNSRGMYQLFHPLVHSGEIYRILEGELKIPEWTTLSELTKEVLRLYSIPRFKVGEKVTIAKLTQSSSYPYGVTYEMAEASGETYVIQDVKFDYVPMPEEQEISKWKGDFHRYHIGVVRGLLYDWHSSMFELCQTPKHKENLVPRSWKEQRERERKEKDVRLPISFVLGSHRCDIIEGSAGWFLSGDIEAVLEEAGIRHNIEEILVRSGIEVVSPGVFPFVSSAGELEKAIAIVKTYWNNLHSKDTEVAKEDMAQMLNASREQLLEAIDVRPNSKVNTDIIL